MVKIAPSVLACDFSRLGEECRDVLSAGADWLHYDVMDGVFVSNLSLGIGELKSLSDAVDAFYDVHLMITDPIKYIKAFSDAGADMITFHIEAVSDPLETIKEIRTCGKMAGITLRPKTPACEIFPYLKLVDMVLVMTVEPGLGGQSFMQDQCAKITEIKEKAHKIRCRGLLIEVDGGINKDTACAAAKAGANVLVAGSAVFDRSDRKEAIAAIKQSAEQ